MRPPKPDRAFRPFRPRHRCPDRPCADEACRPPSPVWFDLSPMHRASAFAPHGFAGPAARSREKTGSLPPNDRIVPSTGMRPFTETSSFRPPLRTGAISERLLAITPNLFPTNPTAKASVAPKTDAPPCKRPPKTERGTERPSVSLRTTFFVAASSPAQPPSGIHIYRTAFGQAGTKNLRRRTKPAQEHAPYPPTDGIPKQCSEKPKHAATKSKKDSRTKLRIPTYRTSLPQTDIRILPQPFFSRKKRVSYTSAPCPQCCDRTQNGKGKPALRRAVVSISPPPVFTRIRLFSGAPPRKTKRRRERGRERRPTRP